MKVIFNSQEEKDRVLAAVEKTTEANRSLLYVEFLKGGVIDANVLPEPEEKLADESVEQIPPAV